MRDGEPWFVAADVCKALEVQNPTDAIKKLDEDEKARLNLGLSGGDTNVVNEPGLYGLVLRSRKPEAKAFKRWITHEVIPSIRSPCSELPSPKPSTSCGYIPVTACHRLKIPCMVSKPPVHFIWGYNILLYSIN